MLIGDRDETIKKRPYEELSTDKVERIVLPLCRSLVKSVKVY